MNFQTICRVCISRNSDMQSIFETYNFSSLHNCEIFKVITDCASVQIQELDGFSEKICRRCLQHLTQAYCFKKLCEESDYKFRNNLITNDEIKVKSEFSADDNIFTCGEIHNPTNQNANADGVLSDVMKSDQFRSEEIEIKCEQCNDISVNEDKLEEGPNGVKSAELKGERLSSIYIQKIVCNDIEIKREQSDNVNQLKKQELHTKYKKKMKRNKDTTNKGEKEYNCNICEKKFTLRGTLIKHSRLHSGDKPFECNFCEKKFATSSYLAVHVRTHTGEKPYKCDLCEKKFVQGGALANHMTLHTGERNYKCNYCEKTFRTRSNLIPHMRMHAGDKQYKCEFCEKEFAVKSNLTTHIRIHTGEKPFNCDICGKTFARSRNLTAHIRLHTTNPGCNRAS